MKRSMLSTREIRSGLDKFLKANVLWFMFSASTAGALYTGMLLSVGMTGAQIGWAMSIPLFTLPAQVAGVIIQQRFFNRKRFWVSCQIFSFAMYAALALMVLAWPSIPKNLAYILFLIVIILANTAYNAQRAPQLAWQTEIVPAQETSVFWNRMMAQGMVSSVVSGFIMGWIADALGRENRSTFVVVLIIGIAFAVMSLRLNSAVPDPNYEPEKKSNSDGGVLSSITGIVTHANFAKLSAVFSLHSAANWISASFIFVHLQKTMSFSMVQIQILMAVSCTVSFAAGRMFEVIGRHFGRKPVLMICLLMKSVEFLLWSTLRPGDRWLDEAVRELSVSLLGEWAALPPGMVSAIPVFILGGFVNVGISAMQLAFSHGICPGRNSSLAIGLFWAFSGIAGGVAAGISGSLSNLISSPGFGPPDVRAFFAGAGFSPFNILAFLSAALYLAASMMVHFLHEDGAARTLHVVKVIFSNNPIRNVYYAQSLSNALTESARTGIISHARGGLVENELVRDLQSASSQVREEALKSLSASGNAIEPAAAEEIIHLTMRRDLGLRAEAAKALGKCGCRSAVPTLEALMEDPETSIAQAAAQALGMLALPESLPSLLKIVNTTSTPPSVKAYAAEAASRIGDHKVARSIFSAFAENTGETLINQCLVSICRCMEDGPHVYKHFENEIRRPGSEIIPLAQSISRRWHSPDIDTYTEMFDSSEFSRMAGCAAAPLVAFCRPCERPEDTDTAGFLRSQFLPSGKFADPRIEGEDYVAVSLWLQLKLWSFLEYGNRSDQWNRIVLLSVMFLCDRLSRRLDPQYIRNSQILPDVPGGELPHGDNQ